MVKSAAESLSISEKEAVISVFKELNKKEGVLVASRVAVSQFGTLLEQCHPARQIHAATGRQLP